MKLIRFRYADVTHVRGLLQDAHVFLVCETWRERRERRPGEAATGWSWTHERVMAACDTLETALVWAQEFVLKKPAAEGWRLRHYAAERPYWTRQHEETRNGVKRKVKSEVVVQDVPLVTYRTLERPPEGTRGRKHGWRVEAKRLKGANDAAKVKP